MHEISIRPATVLDAKCIFDFIVELAVYEKAGDEVRTSQEELAVSLLGPDAKAHCLICSIDAVPVGYAVYFYNYSTWLGKNGIYLEDVYVTPAFRGQGAGKALLRHIAQLAVAQDCGRFEWSVLDWNTPAIAFYEAIGARAQNDWTTYRLAGADLKNFASG